MKKIVQIEPSLGKEERAEINSVIDSGWFTEGAKTQEFEKRFANFVGSKYACVVTSGTSALSLALKSQNIGKGDEVIVPDFTFVASPNSIEMIGAKPIMVDIEPNSLNLDLEKVTTLISKKTKAIMPVDFNGRSTNMIQLKKIAKENNLLLIEDACHAIGCYYNQKHMGNLSDVGVFSFSTPKIITTGQGGMITTNNKKTYERCMELKDFGRTKIKKSNMMTAFEHNSIGYNFKFTEFQAAVGIAQMKKLDKRVLKKKEMFGMYRELLSKVTEVEFIETDLKKITPWMVDIIFKNKKTRNDLIDFLKKRDIETRIYYPPIHRLPPYKKKDGLFQITSNISDRGLWLPSSVTITEEQIHTVCRSIKNFFNYAN